MLTFLSKIYSYFAVKRKKDFDSGKIPVVGLSIPVFSVGNISVGGTGKTPFAIMLAKFLKDCGHRPAVVGRGYKRKSRGEVVVSDGKSISEISAAVSTSKSLGSGPPLRPSTTSPTNPAAHTSIINILIHPICRSIR